MAKKPTRKPERPPRPDPAPPLPPTFPDPWFPDIAIHLSGANWDLENLVDSPMRTQLLAALVRSFPGRAAQFAFDFAYQGNGTRSCLSLGLWGSASTHPDHVAARRRGLIAVRSNGNTPQAAEIIVSNAFLSSMILRNVPNSMVQNVGDGMTLTLQRVAHGVTVVPPSSLFVSASYAVQLPVLGTLSPTVAVMLTFGARGGALTVTSTNLQAGDFGIGDIIPSNVLNPLGAAGLLFGGLALGWFVIHNVGSGREPIPPLPELPVQSLGDLMPRELPMADIKFTLTYGTPTFVTRGNDATNPGLLALRIPAIWANVNWRPSMTVNGPRAVNMPDPTAVVRCDAVTTDLVRPTITWTVNGRVQPDANGPLVWLDLNAPPTSRIGSRHTFVIEATATDALTPTRRVTARMTVTGTRTRPQRDDT